MRAAGRRQQGGREHPATGTGRRAGGHVPGKLTRDDAVRLLDSRPESGWENMEAFSKALEQAFPQLKDDLPQVVDQFSINSRYFRVNYTGNTDELTLRVVSQFQVNNEAGEIVTWQRRYRMIE